MNTALLLIAHGSREPDANDDLRHIATELRKGKDFDIVETAFLELAQPSILEGASHCIEQGAKRVVLLPYFLSAGVHVCRDLTSLRAELAAKFGGVEILLAQPLGRHALLLDVVLARAREALMPVGLTGGKI